MKGIYRCAIVQEGEEWGWIIYLISGGKTFSITPQGIFSSPTSARRSARRIADKLNIEIEFEE